MTCGEPLLTTPDKLRVSTALCTTLATLRWLAEHGAPSAPAIPTTPAYSAPADATPAPAAPPPGTYACGTCTLENFVEAPECAACGAPAPHFAAAGAAAHTASGDIGKPSKGRMPQGAGALSEEEWLPVRGDSKHPGGAWGSGGGGVSSSGGGGGPASASKLTPLAGDTSAVLKMTGAGSSFSKNGKAGQGGHLLKFQEGTAYKGMVLTVVTGPKKCVGRFGHVPPPPPRRPPLTSNCRARQPLFAPPPPLSPCSTPQGLPCAWIHWHHKEQKQGAV
jgi:hypothetical protein